MEGQINHRKCGAGRTFSCSKWHMYHMWAFHIGFPEKGSLAATNLGKFEEHLFGEAG